MAIDRNAAANVAEIFASMLNQIDGVLSVLDDTDEPAERTRLENARSGVQSCFNYYYAILREI